jgi:hypothetical protein
MKERLVEGDFCVVGGGMAGICAAIAAARHGARVVLINDRPVLGGNSSSEIRVHIQGASRHGKRKNARETGIIEELQLENVRRNPQRSFSMWDLVLYDKVFAEPNITLLLNASVQDATTWQDRVDSVRAWQTTTQTWLTVRAKMFADCSGDSVLAPLAGAEYRVGREARSEFNESMAPEVADNKTLGMSLLFGAKDMGRPMPYEPPPWAYDFPTEESFGKGRTKHVWLEMGYWWIELGGDRDSIGDTEEVRHELLRVLFGMWDHIKNHGDHGAANWALDWIEFLPGKRESRRYVGDHILTEGDVLSGGNFADTVAYGGWSIDLHPPGGFFDKGQPPATQVASEELYGIPYRCLYSRNVNNLFFAGRNISASHVGMGTTRVMGTGGVMGQAAGTAAAMAVRHGMTPREVGAQKIAELQRALLADDCFLPRIAQAPSEAARDAKLTSSHGPCEALRDGVTRPYQDATHDWVGAPGDWVECTWAQPRRVEEARISFDSDFCLELGMTHLTPAGVQIPTSPPPALVKAFRIEARLDGTWQTVARQDGNYQRFVRVPLNVTTDAIRLIPESTYGAETVRLYRFEVM